MPVLGRFPLEVAFHIAVIRVFFKDLHVIATHVRAVGSPIPCIAIAIDDLPNDVRGGSHFKLPHLHGSSVGSFLYHALVGRGNTDGFEFRVTLTRGVRNLDVNIVREHIVSVLGNIPRVPILILHSARQVNDRILVLHTHGGFCLVGTRLNVALIRIRVSRHNFRADRDAGNVVNHRHFAGILYLNALACVADLHPAIGAAERFAIAPRHRVDCAGMVLVYVDNLVLRQRRHLGDVGIRLAINAHAGGRFLDNLIRLPVRVRAVHLERACGIDTTTVRTRHLRFQRRLRVRNAPANIAVVASLVALRHSEGVAAYGGNHHIVRRVRLNHIADLRVIQTAGVLGIFIIIQRIRRTVFRVYVPHKIEDHARIAQTLLALPRAPVFIAAAGAGAAVIAGLAGNRGCMPVNRDVLLRIGAKRRGRPMVPILSIRENFLQISKLRAGAAAGNRVGSVRRRLAVDRIAILVLDDYPAIFTRGSLAITPRTIAIRELAIFIHIDNFVFLNRRYHFCNGRIIITKDVSGAGYDLVRLPCVG